MDIIEYPERLLPLPRRDDYSLQPEDRSTKTEMEDGVRSRREYPDDPSTVPVSWVFSAEQAAIFEAWEKHMLKGGTEWFRMNLLTAAGMSSHVVRFEKRPVTRLYGGQATVSATLHLEERNTLTEDEVLVLIAAGGIASLGISELHTIIHTDLPGPYHW